MLNKYQFIHVHYMEVKASPNHKKCQTLKFYDTISPTRRCNTASRETTLLYTGQIHLAQVNLREKERKNHYSGTYNKLDQPNRGINTRQYKKSF